MAAQFVTRHEFDESMTKLYARLTRYIDSRFEVQSAQITDSQNDLRREIVTLAERMGSHEKRLDSLEKRLGEVIDFQKALLDAFTGFARDISKQMADGFSAQAERHNELMQRVARLEAGRQ